MTHGEQQKARGESWDVLAREMFESIVILYDIGLYAAEDALQECVELRHNEEGCSKRLGQDIDIFCAVLRGDMGMNAEAA